MHLVRILDTNGDGTGTTNANGNYASAADDFYIKPPVGTRYEIDRLIVFIQDTGAFDAELYGNGAILTNGISLLQLNFDGTTRVDLTGGLSIKSNADWGRLCYDVDVKTWGTGDEVLLARFTFSKFGGPLTLDGDAGQSLVVRLNDNLSALVYHYFTVEGQSITEP